MEELKVGDRVKIADDSPLARRVLKESNAGDGPYKWSLFGKIGIISQSWTVNGNYAVTMDDENEYCWPPILLEKLPAETGSHSPPLPGTTVGEMEYASHRIVSDYMTSIKAAAKVGPFLCLPAKCRCKIQIGSDPSPSPPGVAEIVFYHVVKDGKCMLQIAEIRGIELWDDLPVEYKFGYPVMWGSRGPQGGIVIYQRPIDVISKPDREVKFCVGQLLTEEEAAKLVKRMRACGKRLHDINVASRAKADEERLERWKAKGQKVVRI
jgi:hypothetical protein